MEVDLEVEDDPIKRFLACKLEEIRCHNSELERQIARRKELYNEHFEKMSSKIVQGPLLVSNTWQRKLDDRWILGMEIKNTVPGIARKVCAVLKWNSKSPFVHATKIFARYHTAKQHSSCLPDNLKRISNNLEERALLQHFEGEWTSVDEIKDSSTLIVVFDCPDFLETAVYSITGVLTYEFKGNVCQLNVPRLCFSVQDATDAELNVKSCDVASGADEAFLSVLAGYEEFELVAKVSGEPDSTLENVLQSRLKFLKINIPSNNLVLYFEYNKKCYIFILQRHNFPYDITILCRDEKALHVILHFLYQKVPDIVILPKSHSNSLSLSAEVQTHGKPAALNSVAKEFGRTLESQITLISSFWSKQEREDDEVLSRINTECYVNFRSELADLELTADLLCSEIDSLKEKNSESVE